MPNPIDSRKNMSLGHIPLVWKQDLFWGVFSEFAALWEYSSYKPVSGKFVTPPPLSQKTHILLFVRARGQQ